MHIIVSNLLHLALAKVAWCTTYQFLRFFYHDLCMTFSVFGHKDSCWLGLGNQILYAHVVAEAIEHKLYYL